MSKKIYRIVVTCLLLFSGCTMLNQRQKKNVDTMAEDTSSSVSDERRSSATVQYTFLDTLNRGNELQLNEEDFGTQSDKVSNDMSSVAATSEIRYRVQLLASSRIETVREQKKMVEKKISEPILIGYEAPYYKLYAGDFSRRQDAQSLLPKVKRLGFPDAWVVSTKVLPEN